ncbi:MAG: glycosyltransferase family 4 protein [Pseudomonadota bacterium]
MKILNISSLYPPNVVGGAEVGLRTISEAMSQFGHELHVVTLQPEGVDPVIGRERRGSVQVTEVPLANLYWPFKAADLRPNSITRILWHGIDTANHIMAKRVQAIVNEIDPDIVLTRNIQGFSTAVIPAIKRTGKPLVHVLHDYSLICPRTTMFRNGKACGMLSERCFGCRALTAPRRSHLTAVDGVIGVSKAVLDAHLQHGLFTGIRNRVIYNALKPNIKPIKSLTDRRRPARFTFGFMGRVEQSKGVETLLKAFSALERHGIHADLHFAGRGEPEYLEMLKLKWPQRNIRYLGYVEANSFLEDIDCLVFPTESVEALGNSVFEAFSKGIPVIGSNTGGIVESLTHDKTGFVFTPGNENELAGFMYSLLMEPDRYESMSQAALYKSREYKPESRASEYLDFLDQVTSAKHYNAA